MKNKLVTLAMLAGIFLAVDANAAKSVRAQTPAEPQEEVMTLQGETLTGHWNKGHTYFRYTNKDGEIREMHKKGIQSEEKAQMAPAQPAAKRGMKKSRMKREASAEESLKTQAAQ